MCLCAACVCVWGLLCLPENEILRNYTENHSPLLYRKGTTLCTCLVRPVFPFLGLAKPYINTVYDRIFGGFPAKNTVYTPYIYTMVLANPIHFCTYIAHSWMCCLSLGSFILCMEQRPVCVCVCVCVATMRHKARCLSVRPFAACVVFSSPLLLCIMHEAATCVQQQCVTKHLVYVTGLSLPA